MKALIIGAGGYIGAALQTACELRGWDVTGWTRKECDLLNLPDEYPNVDVVYLCAAMTRFIDCESNPLSYRINVDAPIAIAKRCFAQPVFLSSEAVERALHTAYGIQKAHAELGLPHDATIVRLSKVSSDDLVYCCGFLADLAGKPGGIYRWP